jgi:short-subunit dehydrogenase
MKTALITGASSGLGFELAKLFAKDKTNVVLVARNEAKLKSLAIELEQDYAIKATIITKDLSYTNAVDELLHHLQQQNIDIDYLVNNAGFGDFGFFYESKWAKQQEMINVNIIALTKLTHALLPSMLTNGYGKILNVASTAAFQPGPTMSVYYASKAFVLHFSEAISNELEDKNITVTALCPGAFESGFQEAAAMEESKLVKGKKLPSSKDIALFGYRHFLKGTKVCIPGTMNYIMANSIRFIPRNIALKIVRFIQDKK